MHFRCSSTIFAFPSVDIKNSTFSWLSWNRFSVRTASIEQPSIVENSSSKHDNTWYDMQGRKLNAKPTEPGIYIIGGNKILIK